jgi:hypothetical protein
MSESNNIYKLYMEQQYNPMDQQYHPGTLDGALTSMLKEVETRIRHLEGGRFTRPNQQAEHAGRLSELKQIKEQLADIIANYVD